MKDFIPSNEALELKQLSFDEPCFGYYDNTGKLFFNTNGQPVGKDWVWEGNQIVPTDMVLAPTFSQAFRWFREQQEWPIESWIRLYISQQPRSYGVFIWTRGQIIQAGVFSTHDEAQLNLLRKLIEIVKNK
jgi:hypothetical protein